VQASSDSKEIIGNRLIGRCIRNYRSDLFKTLRLKKLNPGSTALEAHHVRPSLRVGLRPNDGIGGDSQAISVYPGGCKPTPEFRHRRHNQIKAKSPHSRTAASRRRGATFLGARPGPA
jgi:hypothetical protein